MLCWPQPHRRYRRSSARRCGGYTWGSRRGYFPSSWPTPPLLSFAGPPSASSTLSAAARCCWRVSLRARCGASSVRQPRSWPGQPSPHLLHSGCSPTERGLKPQSKKQVHEEEGLLEKTGGQAGFGFGPEGRVMLSATRVCGMVQRIELAPPEESRRAVAAPLLPWATPAQSRI